MFRKAYAIIDAVNLTTGRQQEEFPHAGAAGGGRLLPAVWILLVMGLAGLAVVVGVLSLAPYSQVLRLARGCHRQREPH